MFVTMKKLRMVNMKLLNFLLKYSPALLLKFINKYRTDNAISMLSILTPGLTFCRH